MQFALTHTMIQLNKCVIWSGACMSIPSLGVAHACLKCHMQWRMHNPLSGRANA